MFLESEVFGDENYLDDFMVVVEDEIKDNPHLENECIKGNNTTIRIPDLVVKDVHMYVNS